MNLCQQQFVRHTVGGSDWGASHLLEREARRVAANGTAAAFRAYGRVMRSKSSAWAASCLAIPKLLTAKSLALSENRCSVLLVHFSGTVASLTRLLPRCRVRRENR